ncbi:hypothetical protein A2U01_0055690 [Trifolium medium]|uniref:Transmembrane protein n=1 Tax=Trifolium medium TaxID=97028 RepID=A0A392RFA7_9FABA|nr:hypothetical protein [Trifolium medium]
MDGGDVVFVKKLKTRKGGIILLLLTLYVKWIVNVIIVGSRGLEDEKQEEGEKEE